MAFDKLVSLASDWAKEKLKTKEEVIALLKRFGYERSENNFESLYAHTLVALSNKHKEQLAAVLRAEEVIAAFRDYCTTRDFEPFSRKFTTRLQALKHHYDMPDLDVEAELKGFVESYDDLVRRVATPTEQAHTALLEDMHKDLKDWRHELRQAHVRSLAPSGATPASNIPIQVPHHFMGRDDSLAAIAAALARYEGRVAIAALHGLRGVGKTTLAAAYAEHKRQEYRATWWIRAQTDASMRADLVRLGVQLGWVAADEKEEPALAAVAERLRHEGAGILLIYDNAIDAASLKPYLPRGGRAHVLVTTNAHALRAIAEPVQLQPWPKEIGADYLIARTGRTAERAAAEALSQALGGLPLAHEQAAGYCEWLNTALAEYAQRFDAEPEPLMDDTRHAPAEYHDGLTVAKTFGLAIEKAAELHPAAEPLIVHAALLAPEPIPLFLFAEGREKLGKPLATALADDGIDEAVAALRAFALVDAETIMDERDPAVATDCIRLHRLVRQVAAARRDDATRDKMRRALIEAAATVYPENVFHDSQVWPRARRLDPLALALIGGDTGATSCETSVGYLLTQIGGYRKYAALLQTQGDLVAARSLLERAIAVGEKVRGAAHPDLASSVSNLGRLLRDLGQPDEAEPLFRRAIAIGEKALGADHPLTQRYQSHYARLLLMTNRAAEALRVGNAALAIHERVNGPSHPWTKDSACVTADALDALGRGDEAKELRERYGIEANTS